jgi:hypothetical protein
MRFLIITTVWISAALTLASGAYAQSNERESRPPSEPLQHAISHDKQIPSTEEENQYRYHPCPANIPQRPPRMSGLKVFERASSRGDKVDPLFPALYMSRSDGGPIAKFPTSLPSLVRAISC